MVVFVYCMKIAFLVSKWPVDGGIETVTRTLANELVDRGHIVYVVYTEYSYPEANGPFVDCRIINKKISAEGLDVLQLKKIAREYVYRLVLDESIDVVINQCFPTWTSDILKDISGYAKIIECLHMTLFYPSSYHRLKWKGFDLKLRLCGPLIYSHLQKKWRCEALMREFPFINRFVFLSSSYVSEFLRFTKYNNADGMVTYMNNPLPLSVINYSYKELRQKENSVLCVARLSEMEKRISYMISVWKDIEADSRFDDWRFDIVGDGPSADDYKQMAVKLGLRRVFFHGYQNPIPFYKKSKVLLMTSVAEGFPMTITESQCYGVVPLVMKTFSSVYDIIENRVNGIIVPKNQRKFKRALKKIMINNSMREEMAVASIKRSNRFNVKKIVDKWEKLINDIPLS